VKRLYFRGDADFANPEVYEFFEAEGMSYTIRLPRKGKLGEPSMATHQVKTVTKTAPAARKKPLTLRGNASVDEAERPLEMCVLRC